jgi:hypothetical protein
MHKLHWNQTLLKWGHVILVQTPNNHFPTPFGWGVMWWILNPISSTSFSWTPALTRVKYNWFTLTKFNAKGQLLRASQFVPIQERVHFKLAISQFKDAAQQRITVCTIWANDNSLMNEWMNEWINEWMNQSSCAAQRLYIMPCFQANPHREGRICQCSNVLMSAPFTRQAQTLPHIRQGIKL